MANTNVLSGSIEEGGFYVVSGKGSITYGAIAYSEGQQFKGLKGITTYTVEGSAVVWQVLTLSSIAIEEVLRADSVTFHEKLFIQSIAVETVPLFKDKFFQEHAELSGIGIETIEQADKIVFPDRSSLDGITVETVMRPGDLFFPEYLNFQGLSLTFEPKAAYREKFSFLGLGVEFEVFSGGKIIWIN